MYQIKINSYSEIITDNINLDEKYYFQFIDNAEDISYVDNNGFIIKYNNDSYFFRFTNQENRFFKHKDYELLPYTHQRLIRNYHIMKGIIETELEKRDYLDKLKEKEPKFLNIIKNNFKNNKFFNGNDFPIVFFIELMVLNLLVIKTIDHNYSFDLNFLNYLFIDNGYCFIIPIISIVLKNISIKLNKSYKQYKDEKNKWSKKIEEVENINFNNKNFSFEFSPIVEKMKKISSEIKNIDENKKEKLTKELEQIIIDYDKRKIMKNTDLLEEEIYYRLGLLELKVNMCKRDYEIDNIVDIKTNNKTLKKSR